jgi:hypothetical protein
MATHGNWKRAATTGEEVFGWTTAPLCARVHPRHVQRRQLLRGDVMKRLVYLAISLGIFLVAPGQFGCDPTTVRFVHVVTLAVVLLAASRLVPPWSSTRWRNRSPRKSRRSLWKWGLP